MKKIAVFVAMCLCAMALTLTACNSKQGAEINDGTVTVEGSQLTIGLKSNATTGFEWIETVEGNNLKFAGKSYNEPKSDALGAGGIYNFVYKAEGTGTTTITFTYARSWENVAPEKTLTMKIDVKGGKVVQIENSGSSNGVMQFK